MYHISRVCVGNYGHGDARFKSSLADFRKYDGETAGSIMLYAQNGNGKTTFLSFMLHVFVPKKTMFVQGLQKPQHSMEHYFREGEPGFIVIELVRKEKALLNTDKPEIIIGAIIDRHGDELSERFFIVDPRGGTRLEDIDFIKPIFNGERANVTKEQTDSWIKSNRNLANVFVYDTQAAWKTALKTNGFNLKSFEAMVTMASKEGGIEKFLESSNPDEILKRVFDLFTDEGANQAVIEELEGFLQNNADSPKIQRLLEAESKILEMEKMLVSANRTRAECKQGFELSCTQASAILAGVEKRVGEILEERGALRSSVEGYAVAEAGSNEKLKETRISKEAVRILGKRRELHECEEARETLSKEKTVLERDRHILDCLPDAQRVTEATGTRDGIKRQLDEINDRDRDRYAPLHAAGTAYFLSLKSEIAFLKKSSDNLDRELEETRNSISEMEARDRQLGQQIDREKNRLNEAETARAKIRETLSEINAMSDIECLDVSDAERIRSSLMAEVSSKRELLATLGAEIKANTSDQSMAEMGINRLATDLETAQGELAAARQTLANYEESESEIKADHLEYLKPGEEWDIENEDLDVTLENDANQQQQRLHEINSDLSELDQQIAILSSSGMFVDKDVEKALELCREAGVADVSTYPSWISANLPTADEARSFTEGNLHFTLGIKVNSENDLLKIKKAFDRKKWKLDKPVPVTVVRPADSPRAGRDERQFVLSAATDYAYHEPTRTEELLRVEGRKADKEKLRDGTQSILYRIESCKKALQLHRRTYGNKKKANFIEGIEIASLKVLRLQKDMEDATDRLTALKDQSNNLKSKSESADSEMKTAAELSKRADALVSIITRNLNAADLDLSLPGLRNEVEALERDLANTLVKTDALRVKSKEFSDRILKNSVATENLMREIQTIRHGDKAVSDGNVIPADQAKRTYEDQLRLYESAETDQVANELKTMLMQTERELESARKVLIRRLGDRNEDHNFKADLHSRRHMNDSEIKHALETNVHATKENERRKSELDTRIGGLGQEVKVTNELSDVRDRVEAAYKDLLEQDENTSVERNFDVEIKLLQETISEIRGKKTESDRRLIEMNTLATKLDGYRDRLRDACKEPLPNQEPALIDDGDWDAATKEAITTLKNTRDEFNKRDKQAQKLHDQIVRFIQANDETLSFSKDGGIKSRISQTNDHRDHGEISERLVELLDRSIKSSEVILLRTRKSHESLVNSVTKVLDEAISKVISASSVKVPAGDSPFSGHPLIKLPKGIDRTALNVLQRAKIAAQYVDSQIADTKRTQLKSTSKMSVDLLKLVALAHGQESFCLRVLKPVDHTATPTWEEIHKMTGSGGQTITAALLLVMVASTMSDDDNSGKSHQSFMILDNPIGKANKPSLVGLQLEMAKIFNIQMISTSGINDRYLSKYEWIVSFNVATRYGKTQETSIHYNDNIVDNLTHRLKTPASASTAA